MSAYVWLCLTRRHACATVLQGHRDLPEDALMKSNLGLRLRRRFSPLFCCAFALLATTYSVAAFADGSSSDPAAARRLITQGISDVESGKYADAVSVLSKAQQLDPTASITPLYLGLAYEREDRLADAKKVWDQYVALPPGNKDDQDLQQAMREVYLPAIQRSSTANR